MEVKKAVIIKKDGSIKGLYQGSLKDILANVEEGENYKEVDETFSLPPIWETNPRAIEVKAKVQKRAAVAAIKVTVNNKTFDGDEISQERMLRAINIANITGQTTTEWKLADNSIQTVTLDELKEALSLAGQEMSRIWLEKNK